MVSLGQNINSVGALRNALKDIPDDAFLNIGNRENGFSVDQIYYDGLSVALETTEEGVFEPVIETKIAAAKQCLVDNGIAADEADYVLQALGYILLNTELFPDKGRDEASQLQNEPAKPGKEMLGKALEAGMVGVIKHDLDIKKQLRGRPFVVTAVGNDGFASCKISIGGKDETFIVHTSQMYRVGYPAAVLGDVFETKRVDGHLLSGVDRDELIVALEQAPVGTVITGVRDAPGSYAYGKYDFDTHIEKRGGHVQNYFAPIKTTNYETWWTVDGDKRNVFDLANILQGKSKYYALTEPSQKEPLNSQIHSASTRVNDNPSPQKAISKESEPAR